MAENLVGVGVEDRGPDRGPAVLQVDGEDDVDPAMRAAVMLRYFEDMTEPEIAATLGISLGTVKSTMSRAVARLRMDPELGKDSGALCAVIANLNESGGPSLVTVRAGAGF